MSHYVISIEDAEELKLLSIFIFLSTFRWWDCISFPDDVDRSDDTAFRMQIQQLAFKVRFHLSIVTLSGNFKGSWKG